VGNSESARRMADAANAFLEATDGDPKATHDFGDETARRDWHYIPRRRAGLSFRHMDAVQAQAAYRLARTALGIEAFAAVTTIIGLEDVLDELEGRTRNRHRADYSVTVFDAPHETAPWGWRFEGHHVSINVTVVDGEVACTPLFLGANPAEIGHVTRPLADEEDLALALIASLDDRAATTARLADDAPDDILTTNAPRLEGIDRLEGVRFAELTGDARDHAKDLVRHYVRRLHETDADGWWRRLEPDLGDVRFAFAGIPQHRRPHYYRLAGPMFFVEYDNTQDEANHVHTVLRDPTNDFGDDALRTHRRHAH
jgi:hypothetical protein